MLSAAFAPPSPFYCSCPFGSWRTIPGHGLACHCGPPFLTTLRASRYYTYYPLLGAPRAVFSTSTTTLQPDGFTEQPNTPATQPHTPTNYRHVANRTNRSNSTTQHYICIRPLHCSHSLITGGLHYYMSTPLYVTSSLRRVRIRGATRPPLEAIRHR